MLKCWVVLGLGKLRVRVIKVLDVLGLGCIRVRVF